MTNEILDTNFSERINIRSKLLNWAELLLLSMHSLLFLASFYFIISDDSGSLIQYLILFLFSYPNLKFVYSSRNATLIYEETQNSKELNTAKKSKSRLIFICTGILLCLLSIAYINYLVTQASLPNMPNSSLSELDNYKTILRLALAIIFPILQFYYMVQTSNIFNFVLDD